MQRVQFCLLILLSIAPIAVSQSGSAPPPEMSTPPGIPNLPAQAIGPNDLLWVSVYSQTELTRTVRVSSDGFIRLPMVEKQIGVNGRLPSEVEQEISKELQAERLVLNPIVSVQIVEYHTHPISVAGAVKNPITFQAAAPLTLLEALTRAGGLAPDAGNEILVSRAKPVGGQSPQALIQRVPVRGLFDGADPELNIVLTGGEEVRVPEIGRIFIVGSVKKPGAYPVQDNGETTLLQALALAEGLQGVHSNEAYIYRREFNGNRNQVVVPLKQIMQRKAEDLKLQANDILYIPEDQRKKVALAVLEKAAEIIGNGGATALAYSAIR